MRKIGLAIFITTIIIIGGISVVYLQNKEDNEESQTNVKLADDTNATAASVSTLVDSLNDFSFDFYNEIIKNDDKNLFFSPYSIFVALSMAYEGADGNTALEMQKILNILQNDSASLGSFGRIYNLLNQKQEGYSINTANAFWAAQDYIFLKSYLNLLENFYMAEAKNLDFSNTFQAAATINQWIEEHTNNKIKDLITADALSEYTKLVLTNAIYFKGQWEKQFDPKNTIATDFSLSDGTTVQVNMMVSDSDNSYYYLDIGDLQVLELNYSGNDLSMIIVLPKQNNISIAESYLNFENLSDWRRNLHETKINVKIPKFKFETKYTINEKLIDMGMLDAFNPGIADFSKMDGTMNLFISKVLHNAFIEVNEEGTEAAAATAVVVNLLSIPDTFNADHPFVFLIQHKETGAILFMGKVLDPSS